MIFQQCFPELPTSFFLGTSGGVLQERSTTIISDSECINRLPEFRSFLQHKGSLCTTAPTSKVCKVKYLSFDSTNVKIF